LTMRNDKPISYKMRFQILKRDNFTCQYCGRTAPDVLLHVDHIIPASMGGESVPQNLITSCQACNLGKGDEVIEKQCFPVEIPIPVVRLVPPTIVTREDIFSETASAVAHLSENGKKPVSTVGVAKYMGIDKASACRRLRKCLEYGMVAMLTPYKPGRPSQYVAYFNDGAAGR